MIEKGENWHNISTILRKWQMSEKKRYTVNGKGKELVIIVIFQQLSG